MTTTPPAPAPNPDDAFLKGIRDWFHALHAKENTGQRARLRRASSELERASLPLVHAFQRRMGTSTSSGYDPRIGQIAQLLAHLKEEQDLPRQSLAHQAAQRAGKDEPQVSELRFRRLLQKEDDELFQALRRTLPLVSGLDVALLARDLKYWNEQVRRKWAIEYFGFETSTPAEPSSKG